MKFGPILQAEQDQSEHLKRRAEKRRMRATRKKG
jgi:hypothetical protein